MEYRSRSIAALLLFVAASAASAQRLSGSLGFEPRPALVILLEARGSDHRPIDTARVDDQGHFAFTIPPHAHGFYQLALGENDRVDVILAPHEPEVDLAFSGTPLQEHITVRKGYENDRLWQYKDLSRRVQGTQRMVMAERASTPADDVEMHQALDSLLDIAFATRERFFEHLLDNWPHSYFARLVKANAAIDAAIPYGSAAALRAIDLADASLMRSSIYPKAVLAYLSLLETDRAETFVLAADSLIALAAPDTACHGYMVEQLVALFATHGPDLALRHVVEQHVLHDTRLPASLRTQAAALLEVATGGAGPDIRLPEPGGDTLLLSQLLPTHNWTLLFFYASDCGYCHEQMPPLVELHRADNGLGVVGIALDTDAGDFFDTLHDEGLPWPSFSELNGWRSQAAEAYKVNATPTLVLLDRERRVVARPRDAGELARLLSDLRH